MTLNHCTRAALALALWLPMSAQAEVFINEIHYDNGGTDVGEAIEVVATAGEDLTAYSIVLYNGNGGVVYDTDAVPSGADVACGATVRMATVLPGQIQNGNPDGVALVLDGTTVVQFLSYGGTLIASDGPAAGLGSTDIGVAESGSTLAGESLQLGGTGSTYADFDWNSAADDTFGACNNNQTFLSLEDVPPTVSGSVPAEGALDVAVGTTITLSFSEAVTVDPSGWTLLCGGAGQGFAVSGSGSSRTITPALELPFSAACTLTLPAASVTDLDEDIDPLAGDFILGFTTGTDLAPTLVSSTPTDGALDFGATANLSLTFSEPVDLGADWFSMLCATSGTIAPAAATVSGGPTIWTIDPNADLVEDESCTLTLNAAAITDQDGDPDPLAGDNTIAFTVVSNPRPVVLSTTPMNASTGFPRAGDLVVLFSESVNVAAGAFTLVCDTSTGIVLAHASSGTSFTVDTGTVLDGDDSCTLTIEADAITDLEGANPLADTIVQFSVATDSVAGYYSKVNTSSPEQLRCSLHETIRDHTEYPYGWVQLEIADEAPADVCAAGAASSQNFILDIYRNRCYEKVADRSNPVGPFNYNREHVWPRSLGFDNTSLAAHNDLHMLHLSASDWNGSRGSKPFADCDSGCSPLETDANNGVGGTSEPGYYNYVLQSVAGERFGSFEVWDEFKGNMARAIFYMAIRYEGGDNLPDLELTDNRSLIVSTAPSAVNAYMGLLTDMLEWHEFDPPDARELDRNEVVYSFQNNRNPFVDHPEWATLALFQSTTPEPCVLNSGNLPPEVLDDAFVATEDQALNVTAPGVLDNDSDNESDPFSAMLVVDVGFGTVSLSADGGFAYTPDPNFCGDDSFSYRANDALGASAIAVASIGVACVNDAPSAQGTLADRTGREGQPITAFSVASGFTDVDQGDVLEYVADVLPAGLGLNVDTGAVTGTPAVGAAALSPYTVTITARDSSAAEATQQFTFTISAAPLDPFIFGNGFEDPSENKQGSR